MHVLTITPDAPLPATTGLHLRMVENLRAVKAIASQTTLAWIATEDRRESVLNHQVLCSAELADEVVCLGARRHDREISSVARVRAKFGPVVATLRCESARSAPYSVRYDHLQAEAVRFATSVEADVVIVPNMFVHWARAFRSAGIMVVCDAADIVSDLVDRQRRAHPRRGIADLSLQVNIAACRAQERDGFANIDELWVTSAGEAEAVWERGVAARVVVVPNCVRAPSGLAARLPSPTEAARPTIGMLATSSYEPNLDAVRTLVEEVFGDLRRSFPDAACVIAGAGLPAPDRDRCVALGATVLGAVDSVATFYDAVDVVVLPIRTRGGLPLKIVEALVAGVAVVATPELIAGTPLRANRDVLVEATSAAMSEAIAGLFNDARLYEVVVNAGRRAYEQHFSPNHIASVLRYQSLVGAGQADEEAAAA